MHRRVVEPFNLSPKRQGAAMVDVVPAVYGADDSERVPSRPLSAYDPRVDSTSAVLLLLNATDSAAHVGKFVRDRPALYRLPSAYTKHSREYTLARGACLRCDICQSSFGS